MTADGGPVDKLVKEFVDVDLSGAFFRQADLSGVRLSLIHI